MIGATLGLCLAGCFAPPQRAIDELARDEREAKELSQSLDHLEGRLLGAKARVLHWQEMKERHSQVSALACANLGRHAEQMLARLEQQKRKESKLKRARLSRPALPEGGIGGPAP